MPDFILEEDSLFDILKNITNRTDEFCDLVSSAESVIDSPISNLLVAEDFYSLEKDGENIANLLYANQGNGDIRDIITRLDIATARAEFVPQNKSALDFLKDRSFGAIIAEKEISTLSWWNSSSMIIVSTPDEFTLALRRLFLIERHTERDFEAFCEEMFDNIYFHARPSLGSLGLDFHEHTEDLILHLSYLNDQAARDFSSGEGDHVIIAKAGSYGVEISPESPKTRANKAAMSERNITICEETLCCEWHTKLTKTRGRIHFHAGARRSEKISSKVGTKVIVGVFADHLTT